VKISLPTVGEWRKRFVEDRLDGLSDESRPGTLRKITDGQVEDVITKTSGHHHRPGDRPPPTPGIPAVPKNATRSWTAWLATDSEHYVDNGDEVAESSWVLDVVSDGALDAQPGASDALKSIRPPICAPQVGASLVD
jgi:hypothetical protein